MAWRPLVATDTANKSDAERAKEQNELEYRSSVLVVLTAIKAELELLNARVEEAFETQIEGTDT